MIACEALFALPHKASFDAGQSNQRFAVLNKTVADFFEKEWDLNARRSYHIQAASSPVEPLVQADITQQRAVERNDPLSVMPLNSKR